MVHHLTEIAKQKIDVLLSSGYAVDEVEIILAYILKLKESLKIETKVNSMIFYNIVQNMLKDSDFESAKTEILTNLSNKSLIIEFLYGNDNWIKVIRRDYKDEIEKIENNESYDPKSISESPIYIITSRLLEESINDSKSSWIHSDVQNLGISFNQ